jgi:hypothetical protein
MQRLARELKQISEQVAGGLNQQAAATLQQALLDLLEQEDEVDRHSNESEDHPAEQSAKRHDDAIVFEAAAAVNGAAGRVVLGVDILLWGEANAPEPSVRLPLTAITGVGVKRVQLNPFKRADCCTVECSQPVRFDFFGADGRELSEQFRTAVEETVATAIDTRGRETLE